MKNKFIKIFAGLCILFNSIVGLAQDSASDRYFPYPEVPDDKGLLSERCNYLVDKFWDRCNIKQSFSALERLDRAFGDWISFMPYATVDTVFPAIDRYLKEVEKSGGDNLLSVGKMAQKWIYCDSAEFYSEDLYLPFAKAISESKKVKKQQREPYATQAKIIESSGLNHKVPSIIMIKPSGDSFDFDTIISSRIILFMVDPSSIDNNLQKARLAADYNLNTLIEQGLVKVVAFYPGENTPQWIEESKSYPSNWITAAAPSAKDYFYVEDAPNIYYLDGRHKVIGKNFSVDALLMALRQINKNISPAQ